MSQNEGDHRQSGLGDRSDIQTFNNAFAGKKVLITGHTGFKGSWLVLWLMKLGAEIVGVSDAIPSDRSHFRDSGAAEGIQEHWLDIRDRQQLRDVLADESPDFVFHLAAQSLVRPSYEEPLDTFETNVLGTANLLEGLRSVTGDCTALMVTSDKSYENVETFYGYRETDRLGGADPYSASKGASEIVISSYVRSFFAEPAAVRVGTVRSGNVIGGGDWSVDRLVPDVARAWEAGTEVVLRKPNSTRPWQHVLEPLGGYLHLASLMRQRPELHSQAFNFGPPHSSVKTVEAVVSDLVPHLPGLALTIDEQLGDLHEAGQLSLNCDKAMSLLGWSTVLDFDETMAMTGSWYSLYRDAGPARAASLSASQIDEYVTLAQERGKPWAQ